MAAFLFGSGGGGFHYFFLMIVMVTALLVAMGGVVMAVTVAVIVAHGEYGKVLLIVEVRYDISRGLLIICLTQSDTVEDGRTYTTSFSISLYLAQLDLT